MSTYKRCVNCGCKYHMQGVKGKGCPICEIEKLRNALQLIINNERIKADAEGLISTKSMSIAKKALPGGA